MKPYINDMVITTDNTIFYYGSRRNYEARNWVEITDVVMARNLADPPDAEALNSMYFLAKRKKKRMFVDPSFFKTFKE